MDKKLHSSEYFGPARDLWWNSDFLEIMAKRWRLDEKYKVLDAGCGVGHWGRILEQYLPKSAEVIGVDSEQKWVDKANAYAQATSNLKSRFSYKSADVTKLPFADNTFDMVTCQTLLIHVKDVKQVMREFMRVVKPKGLLAIVEPNNLIQALIRNSITFNLPPGDIVDITKFHLLCERGKETLGEGNNSVGDMIPQYMAEVGCEELNLYISDKSLFLVPPYSTNDQRVVLDEMYNWAKRDFWIWDKEDCQRYFNAGCDEKSALTFSHYWDKVMHLQKLIVSQIEQHEFSSSGAGLMYLSSGVKPNA